MPSDVEYGIGLLDYAIGKLDTTGESFERTIVVESG